jgi:hypothetical protein
METEKSKLNTQVDIQFEYPVQASKVFDDILGVIKLNKDPEMLIDELGGQNYFKVMPLKHQALIGAAAYELKKVKYENERLNKLDRLHLRIGIYETERVNEEVNRVNKNLKDLLDKV